MDLQRWKSHIRTIMVLNLLQLAVTDRLHNIVPNIPIPTEHRIPVRWQVGAYSPCSVACGGGMQNRTVTCIRDNIWKMGHVVQLSNILCPEPRPSAIRPCNMHECMAQWRKGKWSKCSVTCGIGVQQRFIQCERSMLDGQLFAVSQSECGGLHSPGTSRKCFNMVCPSNDTSRPPNILSEKYILIQLRRAKKLKLNVGGKAKVLPGQNIVVKCPVQHYSRNLLFWSRNRKLLPLNGRVRASSGGLKIFKANPHKDRGAYTCIAGDRSSTIDIQFTRQNDPSTRMYTDWTLRRKHHANRTHILNTTIDRGAYNESGILVTSAKLYSGRKLNSQQQDESRRLAKSLTFVRGPWSGCSATCESAGVQKRKVTCSHVTRKFVKIVPDVQCTRQGLVKPKAVKFCQAVSLDCPIWRPGQWSKCHPRCGRVGFKTRILMCVTSQSGQAAGRACEGQTRPVVRKPCKTKPCRKVCTDTSRYCSLSRLLKLCRYKQFRDRCCQTCRYLYNHTP